MIAAFATLLALQAPPARAPRARQSAQSAPAQSAPPGRAGPHRPGMATDARLGRAGARAAAAREGPEAVHTAVGGFRAPRDRRGARRARPALARDRRRAGAPAGTAARRARGVAPPPVS